MPVMKKTLLAGVVALLLSTVAVRAQPVALPEAMLGYWCFIEGSDADNPYQQSFSRLKAGKSCLPYDTVIIDKDDIYEEVGTCKFIRIKQSAPDAYLVYLAHCINSGGEPNPAEGQRIFELIGEELMVTWMPES
jgi:hypothetical protein